MRLNTLTANLMAENVNRAVEFYRDILGFELVQTVPEEGRFDWAMMKSGGVELMFQARRSLAEELPEFADSPIGGALTLYIRMDDVKGLYAAIRAKVEIVQDLHTTFYGMEEFSLRDCNGFILAFAERSQ